MATPSSMQKMAAEIFSDMVMEEAIKDKTIQVKQQLKDQEGGFIDPNNIDECCAHLGGHQAAQEDISDDDDDFGLDEEEEKIMREIREKRLGEMKNIY